MAPQNNKPSFKLSILSAEGRIYDQEVAALSSTNDAGDFDCLPFHANFISIIKKKVLVHELDGQIKEFPIDNAVLKAINNTVTVFIGLENTDLEMNQTAPKDGTAAQPAPASA
jgi:F0F1-type ATP synthase epsilon subunit